MPRVDSDYLGRLSSDKTIYRYMDFAKFVNLLQTEELHFHQAADFEDRFEGSVPEIIEQARKREYEQAEAEGRMGPDGHQIHAEINKCLRRFTYLNCWHMKEDESVAMWEKYGGSDRAVAIKTTVEDFTVALNRDPDHDIYFERVEYRPYSSDHEATPDIDEIDLDEMDPRFFLTREAHSLVPFVYKRKGFEYEEEMRAIIQEPPVDPELNSTIIVTDGEERRVGYQIDTEQEPQYLDTRKENPNKGLNIPIYLDALIDTVHFAPDAPGWFKSTVENVLGNCEVLMEESEVDDIIQDSIMDHDREPVF